MFTVKVQPRPSEEEEQSAKNPTVIAQEMMFRSSLGDDAQDDRKAV